MNTPLAVAVTATMLAAGTGPFIAVYIGGEAYGKRRRPKTRPVSDDTTEIRRVSPGSD